MTTATTTVEGSHDTSEQDRIRRVILRAVVVHRVAAIYRDRRLRGRIPRSTALRYPLWSTR